jgi:hypothetical protein
MPRFEKLLNSGKEGVGRCVGLCGKAGAVVMRSGASAGKRVAAAGGAITGKSGEGLQWTAAKSFLLAKRVAAVSVSATVKSAALGRTVGKAVFDRALCGASQCRTVANRLPAPSSAICLAKKSCKSVVGLCSASGSAASGACKGATRSVRAVLEASGALTLLVKILVRAARAGRSAGEGAAIAARAVRSAVARGLARAATRARRLAAAANSGLSRCDKRVILLAGLLAGAVVGSRVTLALALASPSSRSGRCGCGGGGVCRGSTGALAGLRSAFGSSKSCSGCTCRVPKNFR